MRFNYDNRAQSEGRVKCPHCKLPMLGVGEDDPRRWNICTVLLKIFCDCKDKVKTADEIAKAD